MNQYKRVTQLFNEYRKKITGSEHSNDSRMFDFIYKHQPRYQTEILDFIYQKAFEDGYKCCLEKVNSR